jgi:two-component system response regulator PilR (NtrC family)
MNFTDEAMATLRRYSFRGNVRELENLVERCVALNSGGAISRELLPDAVLAEAEGRSTSSMRGAEIQIPEEGFDLERWMTALKGHLMLKALDRCDQNRTRAAKMLGMSFRAYRYWLQELGGLKALPPVFPRPGDFPAQPPEDGESEN